MLFINKTLRRRAAPTLIGRTDDERSLLQIEQVFSKLTRLLRSADNNNMITAYNKTNKSFVVTPIVRTIYFVYPKIYDSTNLILQILNILNKRKPADV